MVGLYIKRSCDSHMDNSDNTQFEHESHVTVSSQSSKCYVPVVEATAEL